MLKQVFAEIKGKIDKVETVGFIEISQEFGIPIKKFHNVLLETLYGVEKQSVEQYDVEDPKFE